MNNLEYRRQYVISNSDFVPPSGWNKSKLMDLGGLQYEIFISTHPDLDFCHINTSDKCGAILGYIIDPSSPQLSTKQILIKLLDECATFNDVLKYIYSLSGRYTLIFVTEGEAKLVHDPCGIRKVYYRFNDGDFICCSQPTLIKKYQSIDLSEDSDLRELVDSKSFINSESAWVGDETVYDDVKQLMPNFFLDFRGASAKRYWISEDKILNINETIDQVAKILKGSIEAVTYRRNIMQSVTAGWDSRVLLAASKDVSAQNYYFVNTMNIYKDDHIDIAIPRKIMTGIGLKLNIFRDMPKLRDTFFEMLKLNVEGARKLPKTLAIQYYHDFHSEKMNLNGNGSEILRCHYGKADLANSLVTSDYILAKTKLDGRYPYFKKQIDKWLPDAKKVAMEYNISLLDLFYWEQRMGNWGGAFTAEQDIAVEGFMPFNNRKLLILTLSLDEKYRCGPNHLFYQMLIEKMWPQLLEYPINPESLKTKASKVVKMITPISVKEFIKKRLKF